VNGAWFRLREQKKRPKVLEDARTKIETMRTIIGNWKSKKPWISESVVAKNSGDVDELEKWLGEKIAEQEAKESHEDPAFSAVSVAKQVNLISKRIIVADKTPKPSPTPSPSPATSTDDATASDSEETS